MTVHCPECESAIPLPADFNASDLRMARCRQCGSRFRVLKGGTAIVQKDGSGDTIQFDAARKSLVSSTFLDSTSDTPESPEWTPTQDGCKFCANSPIADELDFVCPVCGDSLNQEDIGLCTLCRGDGVGDCNSCSGTGVCYFCGGLGKSDQCDECDGNGCQWCKNTGYKLCGECEGHGCENCKQTGYGACRSCDGTAKCGECYDGKPALECIACGGIGRGRPTSLVLATMNAWIGGGIIEHAVADLKKVLSGAPVEKRLLLGDLVLNMLLEDGFSKQAAAEIRDSINESLK